ncbi:Superfamily I DNA and RNA helicase [Marinovum algicola DG 898]|nr:Superfamily I DNA and RNA helicase [Marinovum algicola DG 898]
MKYICIDDGAVAELISGREYQSVDFDDGEKLIRSLSGLGAFLIGDRVITHFQDSDGVFLTTSGSWKNKKYLVIDCDQSKLFNQLPKSDSLTSFQKMLRFCSKMWSNGLFNKSERIITGTTKAIIFPLNYAANSGFRIAIERDPHSERLSKRDMRGQFLLVYKSGSVGADSATETADETNFRKVFERLPEVYRHVQTVSEQRKTENHANGQMASTALHAAPNAKHSAFLPFEDWMPILTAQQRSFVHSPFGSAHRLQGPAGTGKTLALMLRTVECLRQAERKKEQCNALIVTHSEATRQSIKASLSAIDQNNFQDRDRKAEKVSLSVETLASLCGRFLSQTISESEFIDRDAQDSKILQRFYIEEAIVRARELDYAAYNPHLSVELRDLLDGAEVESLAPLFQHEISILIKGRAGDSFEAYKNCPALTFGLPVRNDADKGFVFAIFERYQDQLADNSQFDTDDVVISAVGQLDTPIWRRRRTREGFDLIAIDETHLFNINELHVFHHFTRANDQLPISFTVDQAQAVGDRGWGSVESFFDSMSEVPNQKVKRTELSAVFRSSPAIRDFCHSILASGATLFSNFTDTLNQSQSAFTAEEERRSQPIIYSEYADDDTLISSAFEKAEMLMAETESSKSQVLITSLDDNLIEKMQEYARSRNKPITYLDRRGDYTTVRQAEKSGHVVLGHADFVGGLEFNVVVVVGVDKGRVPKEGESIDSNSRSFSSYVAHNRLYVAASRAKFALHLCGVKSRGSSKLLDVAFTNGIISAE